MKRPLVIVAIAAGLLAPATSARAGNTTTGGAQIQWTSSATATMTLVTQYSAAGAQGNAVPTLLPSLVGVCSASSVESNFTMTFGSMLPSPGVPTGCLYKNALAVSVQTNDAAGFVVNEYLDAAPGNGVGICAFPNGGAAFPLAPAVAPVPASTQSGNPAAGTFTGSNLTGCAGGGAVVPTGAGGASSAGTTPGNPGTPSLEFYSPSTAFLTFTSRASATVSGGVVVTMYAAEDLQVNLGPGAKSTSGQTGDYLTLQLIPN